MFTLLAEFGHSAHEENTQVAEPSSALPEHDHHVSCVYTARALPKQSQRTEPRNDDDHHHHHHHHHHRETEPALTDPTHQTRRSMALLNSSMVSASPHHPLRRAISNIARDTRPAF